MRQRILTILTAAVFLFIFGIAGAEDIFGVKVYPGAKYDASTSGFVKESVSGDASCYRTGDSVAKVIEFYKKQPGLKLVGSATKEGALFRRCREEYNKYAKMNMNRCDLDITIQNPWMDVKTGKMNRDTLISIVKWGQ